MRNEPKLMATSDVPRQTMWFDWENEWIHLRHVCDDPPYETEFNEYQVQKHANKQNTLTLTTCKSVIRRRRLSKPCFGSMTENKMSKTRTIGSLHISLCNQKFNSQFIRPLWDNNIATESKSSNSSK